VADPLVKSARAAERMADGHLGATLPTAAPNEIGRIGENINGLAANFQEVLTLVWNQTETAIANLRRFSGRSAPHEADGRAPDTMAELTSAQQELETMRMMVRTFDLYDVAITSNDQLAAKDKADGFYQ
jgi:methyl-accepting chemotaxis protein